MAITWTRAAAGGLVVLLYFAPVASGAAEWTVVPGRSQIGFEYLQNGKPTAGRFTRFDGAGSFDASAPEHAALELRIESASIDLGDRMASAFATSAEWFDAANHPQVVYRLTGLSPLGDDHYTAHGTLTIRGRTRPIETTITLAVGAEEARAEGVLELDRRDFGLGVGPTAIFVEIGRPVSVSFDLTAVPAG